MNFEGVMIIVRSLIGIQRQYLLNLSHHDLIEIARQDLINQ